MTRNSRSAKRAPEWKQNNTTSWCCASKQYSAARQSTAYGELAGVYETRHELFQPLRNVILDRVLDGVKTGSTVLEVGCGCGASLALMRERGFNVAGIDFSPVMARRAESRSGCKVTCGDFMVHEFGIQYDLVFAQAFIHLFPKAAVREVLRKLLALARLRVFFSTTLNQFTSEGWEVKDGVMRYRSRYTRSELLLILQEICPADVWKVEHFELADPLNKNWIDVILTRTV